MLEIDEHEALHFDKYFMLDSMHIMNIQMTK